MLDYIAMGMVFDKARTGYDIKKEVESGIGFFIKASYGSLYPALKKLTEKGYLTMVEEPQGDRVKKYYRATEPGKEAFLEWLAAPFDPNFSSGSLLAKVYFFDKLPSDIRKQQLQEYERHNRQILRKLQAVEKTCSDQDQEKYYMMSTLYFGLQFVQHNIRWFQHIEAQKPLSAFLQEETTQETEGELLHK